MPIEIFDKDGKPLDWAAVNPDEDIPDDVVKGSTRYKTVLTESIERRKELQAAKAKQDANADVKPEEKPTDKPAVTPEPAKVETLDKKALYSEFRAELERENSERAAAVQARDTLVRTVMTELKLNPDNADQRALVDVQGENEAQLRSRAERLVKMGLKFEPTPGGNGSNKPYDDVWANVDEALFKSAKRA